MNSDTWKLKVVVLGAACQGKSALIIRYVTGSFVANYDPTIEDSYRKIISVDDEVVLLDILDTAGQEEFASMSDTWISEGEVFVLVFGIDSQLESQSFEYTTPYQRCSHLRQKIIDFKQDENVPIILVGNKCDLSLKQRNIPQDTAKDTALKWNSIYIEVSAKEGNNLDLLWNTVVREYRKYDQNKQVQNNNTQNNKQNTGNKQNNNNNRCNKCSCNCNCNWIRNISRNKPIQNNNIQLPRYSVTIDDQKNNDHENEYIYSYNRVNNDNNTPKINQNNIDNDNDSNTNKAIKLFDVLSIPSDDVSTLSPILTSIYFNINFRFSFIKFLISLLCGILLPLILIIQNIPFFLFSEDLNVIHNKCYPSASKYKYNDIHFSILFDFLGIIIGRKPGQDPESKKDKKWFLRQTKLQLFYRLIIILLIFLLFIICFYNLYASWDNTLRVSMMETYGPITLFGVIWVLLSLWIANQSCLNPSLPPLTQLRSTCLYFGTDFNKRSTAYKFLRAYLSSIEENWKISLLNICIIVILSILYCSIPGLTRYFIGDPSDGLEKNKFITYREMYIEIGALYANFLLILALLYTIEIQFTKHLDNYREWMYNITMLLNKNHNNNNNNSTSEFEYFSSCNLYLSLSRRINGLGWLEIRSFLSIQGKLFFIEQELPTLWILILIISLSIFICYRVYFINGNPIQSVLFNGILILTLICFCSLLRILIISSKFKTLQLIQEKLLTQQQFIARCQMKRDTNIDMKQNKIILNKINNNSDDTNDNDNKEEEEEEDDDDDEKIDSKTIPLLLNSNNSNSNDLSTEMIWYSRNVGFIEDMLLIIRKNDIHPRFYKIKLYYVLLIVIIFVSLIAIATILKLIL